MAIGRWLVAGIFLFTIPATAGTSAELEKILAKCDLTPDQTCEQQAWDFADLSKDGKLSKAEITRFFRLASALQSVDLAEGSNAAEVMTFFLGPFGAQSVLDNFDYDGDGFLTRSELFQEGGALEFRDFAARIVNSGKDALALGGALAGSSGMNPLAGGRMTPGQAPRPKIKPRASAPPRPKLPPNQIVMSQFKRCWSPPDEAPAADAAVKLRIEFYPDGGVRGEPQVLGADGQALSADAVGPFAHSLRNALYACAPYRLPNDTYGMWHVMDLEINAAELKK